MEVCLYEVLPSSDAAESTVNVWHKRRLRLAILRYTAKGCDEAVRAVRLLNEEGWIEVFDFDVHLLGLSKYTGLLKGVEVVLEESKFFPVVLGDTALPLGR